ncbi:LETM1 domain-containing protein 1 [Cydia splendana]|uniref:LETM1 domain-containing protein 1 n=1 Tax=Cydia splendana TaxID=1100963 RepID=UPI00211FF48B
MPLHKVVTFSRLVTQCSRSSSLLLSKTQQSHSCRFITLENPKHANQFKNEKLRTYIVERYIQYVKGYTKVLENRFPRAMQMYRVFSVGIKDFLKDLKRYIGLRIKVAREQGFSNMSRQDIELYQKMPSDMLRIAPVLILSAIPFGNYVIFPLAFLKPRILLCSHFWSIQQRSEFTTQELTERLRNNKPVFRALQAKLDSIADSDLKDKWARVIGLLGSGVHPSVVDILACKELFAKEPYSLNSLTYAHTGHLLKMYGQRRGIVRVSKLKHKAFMLLQLDRAILREGGVNELSTESLRYACHLRGLNSSHLTNKDMRKWLEKWLSISQHVDKSTYSLLLHCPIFLAYNHPQNWMLIY